MDRFRSMHVGGHIARRVAACRLARMDLTKHIDKLRIDMPKQAASALCLRWPVRPADMVVVAGICSAARRQETQPPA